MAAAAVKGILISISIITALSIAVLENPQIQAWVEEQRRKVVELLRSFGEELDPQSRRQAEAFAFEGRTPAMDESIRREVSGSREAAAVATGRSLSNDTTVRRIPVQGRMNADDAEERRRKGREYLAQRNQQMYELQQRRKETSPDRAVTPPTPTSFDAMVDEEGKLRLAGKDKQLPSPPELVPEVVKAEMGDVGGKLAQPLLAEESNASSSASGWFSGSRFANPFGDEYAIDRSETPKPPVPPKVALDVEERPKTPVLPGSFESRAEAQQTRKTQEELSYEEQLAIALSLSEAEAQKAAANERRVAEEQDPEIREAIAASLNDMKNKLKEQEPADPVTPLAQPRDLQPLVDLTPPSPILAAPQPVSRGQWETLFDQDYSPIHEPLSLAQNQPSDEDELYRVTPDLPPTRLASVLAQPGSSSIPYDPVREAAGHTQTQQPNLMEASFYSAVSSAPSPVSSHTMSHEATPQLVDVSEDVPPPSSRTVSPSSFGFQTDVESDSEPFASMPASRPESRALSEKSYVEVQDVDEDSDVDMLSQEGDGVRTPDSWSEIGSRDGESEIDDEEQYRRSNLL